MILFFTSSSNLCIFTLFLLLPSFSPTKEKVWFLVCIMRWKSLGFSFLSFFVCSFITKLELFFFSLLLLFTLTEKISFDSLRSHWGNFLGQSFFLNRISIGIENLMNYTQKECYLMRLFFFVSVFLYWVVSQLKKKFESHRLHFRLSIVTCASPKNPFFQRRSSVVLSCFNWEVGTLLPLSLQQP